jgi:hypothetical protein
MFLAFGMAKAQTASTYTIDLARAFGRDIFELNGVPYLQPLVQSINATSNSGFFNTAYIPKKDSFYIKISVRGMLGFVRDDQKTFQPQYPRSELSLEELSRYVQIDPIHMKVTGISDTAGLIHYALRVYLNRGLETGAIAPPERAPTVLGSSQVKYLQLPKQVLDSLFQHYPQFGGVALYDILPANLRQTIDTILLKEFPAQFALPQGGDLNTLLAAIPQIEIGSFMGTELLLRFIPPVDFGEYIGNFAFWGVGIKHSISQYFEGRPFDLSVQAVYQGTHLTNTIGVTNAELKAVSTIWDFNVQASKSFEGIIDVYAGLGYEMLSIHSDYKYYLPIEVQRTLGLVDANYQRNPPQYPGDNQPQTTNLKLIDRSLKFVAGLAKTIGPVTIFADYNVSKVNIISGGIQVSF